MIAHAALIFETAREAPFVQVVEEKPADAARFVPMLQEKVSVTPVLVMRIHIRTEGLTGAVGRLMPMQHVFFEGIVRSQIKTAAKPPDRSRCTLRAKEAHVCMRRRHIRVPRMNDERYAHREPRRIRKLRTLRGCARRQRCARD